VKKLEAEYLQQVEEFNRSFPKTVGHILRLIYDKKLEVVSDDGKASEISCGNEKTSEQRSQKFYDILSERETLKLKLSKA
jgi:hypothetical protein